jgi:hypothetical protein
MSVANLAARGISLTTGEALALIQSLLDAADDHDVHPPFGPVSLDNLLIRSDGSVASTASAVTPTVFEAALLLEQLLPDGQPHVPGALRYSLGRALHEVAAPPYDSLTDFSRALRRFETGHRGEIIRTLFARAQVAASVTAGWRGAGLPFAATLLAGFALIGAGETMHSSRLPAMLMVPAAPGSIASRPIVLNPPPLIPQLPALSFAAIEPPEREQPPRAREGARRPPGRQVRSTRPAIPSRVLARITFKFEEL